MSEDNLFNRTKSSVPKPLHLLKLEIEPWLLDLANKLADQKGIALDKYLYVVLKQLLLSERDRLGIKKGFLPEFKSEDSRQVRTWRPNQTSQPQTSQSQNYRNQDHGSDESRPRRSTGDFTEAREGQGRPYRQDGKSFGSKPKFGNKFQGQENRRYGAKTKPLSQGDGEGSENRGRPGDNAAHPRYRSKYKKTTNNSGNKKGTNKKYGSNKSSNTQAYGKKPSNKRFN